MTTNGMCTPHDKRDTCGVCRHLSMGPTRKHTQISPLPLQKNKTTNEG